MNQKELISYAVDLFMTKYIGSVYKIYDKFYEDLSKRTGLSDVELSKYMTKIEYKIFNS